MLVLALADPIFRWQRPGGRLVLVVDDSASMNATDVSPSRLQREGRRRAVDRRPELGDEWPWWPGPQPRSPAA